MEVKQRIQQLLQALNNGVYEKEEVMALSLLSAVAGESIFLLGAPGVAKSLIARRLKYAFKNGKSFEYLMSRFSTPDEIFGPVSISKLKDKDKYERIITNYLPDATIVFLDEIWKAGPSIQNVLLTVLNEKIYRNGEQEIKVPMKALISASNELPSKGEGLEALWDRFLIRLVVEGIRETKNFNAMIEMPNPTKEFQIEDNLQITDKEYKAWSKAIDKIKIPDNVFKVIEVIRKKLQLHNEKKGNKENQIYVSDRRWRKIVRLLRTSAFLNDRKEVDLMDCFLIKECLWNEEGQISTVKQIAQESIQKFGLNLSSKIDAIKVELHDFWYDIAVKTSYIKDAAIPQIYDKYYLVLDILETNRFIEISTYNQLNDEYTPINLYNQNRGYSYGKNYDSFRVKASNQPNTICFDRRIGQGAYDYNIGKRKEIIEIKQGTIKKLETFTFKKITTKHPSTVLKNEWNNRSQKVLELTEKLKIDISVYEKQNLAIYKNNILVNKSNIHIFEENLQYARTSIDKLEVEVSRIKHFYENIKQNENISLSMLNLITNHNHFDLSDLIDYDFRGKNEHRANKFFNKEKCQTLQRYNIINSNDFLSVDKKFLSKLLDGEDNYEQFKSTIIDKVISPENKVVFQLKDIDFSWNEEVYDDNESEYVSELNLLEKHHIFTSEDFLQKEKTYFDFLDDDRYNELKQAIQEEIINAFKLNRYDKQGNK